MTLFYAPNTISVAVAITLNEAGLVYDAKPVDFSAAEQTRPDYLSVNPKGRVPALITDQGILTETGALLDYIAAIASGSTLIPSTPFNAAKMREAMYYLASTMHVNHAHKIRGARWADQESSFADMTAKVPQTVAASCAYLQDNYALDPFVLGDQITLADPYLYVICTWLKPDGVAISDYPKLDEFFQTMKERPSVQKAQDMGMI
ncbi:glutathione S-transferase family protein [Parasulfitobacter algicola]|uniref:Glutathione S-transferase family protein n=1 Tax=Parasulfitobacter algicola TaxID=2614809 RepID=A0ABX2IX45_9RHOB|nr:glutathione S-transferase family protein [Sulfitobacter algicola]NSX54981.1 glutathione S-transferase family protein [Sulfitobacter algicola]